jgi:phage protein D
VALVPTLKARQAKVSLVIGGQDIMLGLASQSIISFCYTDSTSDKADDLSICIADPQRTWMLRYLPTSKNGTECQAGIYISDWAAPFDNRPFECGIFYINKVGFKGPPNVVDIKASSIPPNKIKHTKKNRSWENSNLDSIAGQIASENGLTLFYDTKENPIVKRTDQKDKSDLEYLRDRCKEAKLNLKIHKKQLIVYSEEEYEARPPAFELVYGSTNILDWSFSKDNEDKHKSAENSYVDPETGKITKTKFNCPERPEGSDSELILNEGVEFEPDDPRGGGRSSTREELLSHDAWNNDPAANKGKGKGGNKNSERKAKAKLREKNKKEHQCSIKVVGNLSYLSGLCCQTVGWGIFDRKWFIESSVHNVSDGYTTDLKLRGALKGY